MIEFSCIKKRPEDVVLSPGFLAVGYSPFQLVWFDEPVTVVERLHMLLAILRARELFFDVVPRKPQS